MNRIPKRLKVPLDMPHFKNEEEEAKWWATHQDEVDDFFERAKKAGAITRGVSIPQMQTTQTTVRILSTDIARLKKHAMRKGMRYQAYLKMLIHEALNEREKSA